MNKWYSPGKKIIVWGILPVFAFIILLGWIIAPHWADDPLPILKKRTPLCVWKERNGAILWLERTHQGEWRIEIPLEKIPEDFQKMILAVEDKNFYRHHGVDYTAVCRAFWLNLSHRQILSGGSTVSMQLAGMTLPRKRSWYRKFVQALRARKLEQLHTKKEILAAYLNFLPVGGNIYGVEAGSWYYFGRPVTLLNPAEFLLLCGIPQRPNALRPDRFPKAAQSRRWILLKVLKKQAAFTGEQMHKIENSPILLRKFSLPSPLHRNQEPKEFLPLIRMVKKQTPHPAAPLALDREIQLQLLALMQEHCRKLSGVQDGAAVVIDRKRAEVITYIGTLDSKNPVTGQVDAASALRSAGSTLKPFLYAEAFSAGVITGETLIEDAPVRYDDYAPGNSDARFFGRIKASEALTRSLNTPAIRLVGILGAHRTLAALQNFQLPPPVNGDPGLSVALGTSGATLLKLTWAYAILASQGKIAPLSFFKREKIPEYQIFPVHAGACAMVEDILNSRPLPGCFVPVAWKTGTSNNNCDAWCIGFTPEYAVGVWFGNKSGKRSPSLVGVTAAVPAAAMIFDRLYANKPLPAYKNHNAYFENRNLCAESGLTQGIHCAKTLSCTVLKNIPLRRCEYCSKHGQKSLKILRPLPGVYRCVNGKKSLKLALQTNLKPVEWFLDEMPLALPNCTEAAFSAGQKHILRAVHKDGGVASVEIIVENQ